MSQCRCGNSSKLFLTLLSGMLELAGLWHVHQQHYTYTHKCLLLTELKFTSLPRMDFLLQYTRTNRLTALCQREGSSCKWGLYVRASVGVLLLEEFFQYYHHWLINNSVPGFVYVREKPEWEQNPFLNFYHPWEKWWEYTRKGFLKLCSLFSNRNSHLRASQYTHGFQFLTTKQLHQNSWGLITFFQGDPGCSWEEFFPDKPEMRSNHKVHFSYLLAELL